MFPVKTIGAPPPTDSDITVSGGGVWRIPEETPTAIVYNRRNYAVMLATPQDMADFATGFSLSEKVIDDVSDIRALDILYTDRGVDLRISIDDDRLERLDIRQRRRTLPGNVGCGLCGLENADALFEPLPPVAATQASIDPAVIEAAFTALGAHQNLNARTRSVHGAAWAGLDGGILHLREDVGRHNALDKLLGALALGKTDMKNGFVVMSSRCSYEIVQKAAVCGATAVASISAPTLFAARKAAEANMALYTAGPEGAVRISG